MGAPEGNQNARKHGANAADLQAGRKASKLARDKHRTKARREVRDILRGYGLDQDPLAKMLGRQVGRLEAMCYRLESHHATRGYFTVKGDIKASVNQEIAVVARLLDEARRLLEKLADLRPREEGLVVYVAELLTNGMGFDDGFLADPAVSQPGTLATDTENVDGTAEYTGVGGG